VDYSEQHCGRLWPSVYTFVIQMTPAYIFVRNVPPSAIRAGTKYPYRLAYDQNGEQQMQENEFDAQGPSAQPVIRANKRVRAVALAIWIVGALAGAVAIQWLLPYSEQYVSKQEPQVALRTMQILFAFLFLSVLPLGVYLFRFGYRAMQWRQIPPPGTWVIRNAKVVEGRRAQQRGRIVVTLGVLLFVLGLSCAIYFPYRLGRVFQGTPPQPSAEATKPMEAQ
jgi:hypothetical protein